MRAMNMAVKDVMTTQVFWVERDTPFAAIAAALRQHRVSAFPVLNEAGQVIGVVSESDLLNTCRGVVAVRDRLDYPAPGPDAFDVLARFPVD